MPLAKEAERAVGLEHDFRGLRIGVVVAALRQTVSAAARVSEHRTTASPISRMLPGSLAEGATMRTSAPAEGTGASVMRGGGRRDRARLCARTAPRKERSGEPVLSRASDARRGPHGLSGDRGAPRLRRGVSERGLGGPQSTPSAPQT